MTIQFVGAVTAGASGALSLTSLTGGIGSAPIADDLVIVAIGTGDSSDQNISISTPAGYTEIVDIYKDSIFGTDANLGVYWKVMGGSPDTSVTIPSLTAVRAAVYVLRGVDTTTPLDATTTTDTGPSGSASPPDITTVTANAMVVIISALTSSSTITVPSGFSNLATAVNGTTGKTLISSKIQATAGLVNPPNYSISGGSTSANASATLALRPAGTGTTGRMKVWNGSAWVAKPVKVWNGSAWVTKPAKVWNGSAWVTTTY